MAKKDKRKKEDRIDWLIPAGLFIGIGVGLLTGQVAGFTLIGFGAGFAATYILGRNR